jgi:hypothetical protein
MLITSLAFLNRLAGSPTIACHDDEADEWQGE